MDRYVWCVSITPYYRFIFSDSFPMWCMCTERCLVYINWYTHVLIAELRIETHFLWLCGV